ncbi:MAG: hypothetical protein V4492_01050 [Chlamydiota bacterium]
MTVNFRLNGFIDAARQAYAQPQQKIICANASSAEVTTKSAPLFSTGSSKNENRQTWDVFFKCLNETVGKEKVDWICNRYRNRYNFQKIAASGAPLLPKHVKVFSVGSNQVRVVDVKKVVGGAKLKTMSCERLTSCIARANPFPWIGKKINPFSLWGAPSKLIAHFFHNQLLMDREKQVLFEGCKNLSFHAWLERFTKVTVNRELIEGQIIPAPGGGGKLDYYRVYRKIATGDGLVAYALKPCCWDSRLKALVVFRPTQWAPSSEDATESLCNDFEPKIGDTGWRRALPHFEILMTDPHFRRNNQKVEVAGFSLGGVHAQRFLTNYCESVSKATFYADPGIDDETAQAAASRINAMPRRPNNPLYIEISRAKGDFCHYVGDKHIGWGVNHPDVNIELLEIDHNNKSITGSYLHVHRFFDNNEFDYQVTKHEGYEALQTHLDNTKRGFDILTYENSRKVWGRALCIALKVIAVGIQFFTSLIGLKVLRKSNEPAL